jgi:Lon protease-like protein
MPRVRLPLNIFEPRYLAMIEAALGQGRVVGVVQPVLSGDADETRAEQPHPPLYGVGCAGRVTSFTETDDGRFLVVLTGVCRFTVAEELPQRGAFRRVRADWRRFAGDMHEPEKTKLDRKRFLNLLQTYFKRQGVAIDWNVVQNASDDILVSTTMMISALAPNEKQALLETEDLNDRATILMTLLEMAGMQPDAEGGVKH